MSCCTPTAIGYLSAGDYVNKGHIEKLSSGTDLYVTGDSSKGKAILLFGDVWGWNSGRTRAIADAFAEEGLYVVVAKLLAIYEGGTDGEGLPPNFDIGEAMKNGEFNKFAQMNTYGSVAHKIKDAIEFIKSKNIDNIGALGLCWGVFNMAHAFELYQFKSCVGVHPSIGAAGLFGEDPVKIASMITSPMLCVPAVDDTDDYRPNGAMYSTWKNSEYLKVEGVNHGFFPRGDISDTAVANAVNSTFCAALDFYKRTL